MGKLIIIEPQSGPRVVDHDGEVTLEDLKKHIGDVTVDDVRLGTIPPVGRHADLWIDDEGLLTEAALPNRQLPNGTVICGTMLICSSEGPQSVPLDQPEVDFLLEDIAKRWPALTADFRKPTPSFQFTTSDE